MGTSTSRPSTSTTGCPGGATTSARSSSRSSWRWPTACARSASSTGCWRGRRRWRSLRCARGATSTATASRAVTPRSSPTPRGSCSSPPTGWRGRASSREARGTAGSTTARRLPVVWARARTCGRPGPSGPRSARGRWWGSWRRPDLASAPPAAASIVAAARARAATLAVQAGADDEVGRVLAVAADRFVVRTSTGPTAVAGYPWFGEWSRDLFTSYEGLFLCTGRAEEGRAVLQRAAASVSEGMLANTADVGTLEYNTIDATLWFLHALGRHVTRTGDLDLAAELSATVVDVLTRARGRHPLRDRRRRRDGPPARRCGGVGADLDGRADRRSPGHPTGRLPGRDRGALDQRAGHRRRPADQARAGRRVLVGPARAGRRLLRTAVRARLRAGRRARPDRSRGRRASGPTSSWPPPCPTDP